MRNDVSHFIKIIKMKKSQLIHIFPLLEFKTNSKCNKCRDAPTCHAETEMRDYFNLIIRLKI